ncbi:hypothetical protein BKI52_11185 [marine bacterium AO1-C]|nr:hypothetical protein BKI52_11185 [marine bacterium AO1-C]
MLQGYLKVIASEWHRSLPNRTRFPENGCTFEKMKIFIVMKYQLIKMCLGLFIVIGLGACKKRVHFHYQKRLFKAGDNLAWADPKLNDSQWNPQPISIFSKTEGRFWVRFKTTLTKPIQGIQHKGLQIISLGSYEAYWDGVLVHKNGVLGNDAQSEKPGRFISQVLLPDSLCKQGEHTLALRLAKYQEPNRGSWVTFLLTDYMSPAIDDLKTTAFMFLLGGAYLIIALYYLLLFINQQRDYPKLIFSIVCLLFFGLMMMEYLKFYYNYPYYFHYSRLWVIGSLTWCLAFFIPFFLCLHFELPRWYFWAGGQALVLVASTFFYAIGSDLGPQRMSQWMLMVSIAISLYAIYLKRKGGWVILVALLLVVWINYFLSYGFNHLLFNYDINLFIGFTFIVVAILYLLAQKTKEQRKAYEASLLRSARLQNELLKRHIQPHFIMNTLTSVMEWIEVSPKKSITFIEALAGEFEILNDIADEQLIFIQQEIDLCKKHLEVMSYRKEIKYVWEDSDIDTQAKIPPAVLHTIVENGITHNIPQPDGTFVFRLTFEASAKQKQYTLTTIARLKSTKTSEREGTGFKYIRSRLKESFGDAWQLESKPAAEGWETSIIIFEN